MALMALAPVTPAAASDRDDILALAHHLIVQHGTSVVTILDARAATMRKEGQPQDAQFWQSVADRAATILEMHWTRH